MSLLPAGTTVTVETKYFPPLVVDLSGKTEPGAGGIISGAVVKFIRPRVTVKLHGTTIATSTPAGSPDPNQWDKTKIVLGIAAALVVFSVLRVLK